MCTHTIVLIIHFMYYIAIITHKQSLLFKSIVYLCINIQNYKSQEKQQMAKIVAVGPGGVIDGKEIVMQVKVGDKVLYSKYAGSEFKVDGKELTIIRQSDILAVVED